MSSPRARLQRLAWTFALAAAVLLKAAVPFLAAGAAAAQGLPVAEICSVYGVRTAAIALASDHGEQHDHHAVAAQADGPAPGPHDAPGGVPGHGEHCALGALSAYAPAPPPAVAATAPAPMAARLAARPGADAARDATARWSALRKQGPPPAG